MNKIEYLNNELIKFILYFHKTSTNMNEGFIHTILLQIFTNFYSTKSIEEHINYNRYFLEYLQLNHTFSYVLPNEKYLANLLNYYKIPNYLTSNHIINNWSENDILSIKTDNRL